MNEINIRSASLDDLPILYEFEQGIVEAERPFDPTIKSGQVNYYDIMAMILSKDTEVVAAIDGNELVGSGYLDIKKSKPFLKHEYFGYIGFMYVKHEYRGKGVGQKIIENLKSWAKSRNLNEIRLDVYDDNHRAVGAYEKAGFKKHLVEMRMEIGTGF